MALSSSQKSQVSMMVLQKGDSAFAASIAASDVLALSELAKWLPGQIKQNQLQTAQLQSRLSSLQAKLAILQAK